MECTYRKCNYEHDEYYLVKLYGTTVYVAKACNLYRIGSDEGAEILERENICKDSATGGQMAYLTYLKYRILKFYRGKCVEIMHLNVFLL